VAVRRIQQATHAWEAPSSATPARPTSSGLACIAGFGRSFAVQLRDARVVRFSADDQDWVENGTSVRLTSDVLSLHADDIDLRWTVQEVCADGRPGVRQEYHFAGRLRGTSADGMLNVRMVAHFLQPTVVLSDRTGPAQLYMGSTAHKASA
jgi:hypothetical protein